MILLVVEDDRKVTAFLRKGLQEEGYTVEVAHDGKEALRRSRWNDYDAILLDVMLPEKDGIEVLKELRAHRIMTIATRYEKLAENYLVFRYIVAIYVLLS